MISLSLDLRCSADSASAFGSVSVQLTVSFTSDTLAISDCGILQFRVSEWAGENTPAGLYVVPCDIGASFGCAELKGLNKPDVARVASSCSKVVTARGSSGSSGHGACAEGQDMLGSCSDRGQCRQVGNRSHDPNVVAERRSGKILRGVRQGSSIAMRGESFEVGVCHSEDVYPLFPGNEGVQVRAGPGRHKEGRGSRVDSNRLRRGFIRCTWHLCVSDSRC